MLAIKAIKGIKTEMISFRRGEYIYRRIKKIFKKRGN